MSQNKIQFITGLFRSTNSTAAKASAMSASCQNSASGVHADHGRSRPATASSLATTSVPKRAEVGEWGMGMMGMMGARGGMEGGGFIAYSHHSHSSHPSHSPLSPPPKPN